MLEQYSAQLEQMRNYGDVVCYDQGAEYISPAIAMQSCTGQATLLQTSKRTDLVTI